MAAGLDERTDLRHARGEKDKQRGSRNQALDTAGTRPERGTRIVDRDRAERAAREAARAEQQPAPQTTYYTDGDLLASALGVESWDYVVEQGIGAIGEDLEIARAAARDGEMDDDALDHFLYRVVQRTEALTSLVSRVVIPDVPHIPGDPEAEAAGLAQPEPEGAR